MSRLPHRSRPHNLGLYGPHSTAPLAITLETGSDRIAVTRLDAGSAGYARIYRCEHTLSGRIFTAAQCRDLTTECDCRNYLNDGACRHVTLLTRAGLLLEPEVFDDLVDATSFGDELVDATWDLATVGEEF